MLQSEKEKLLQLEQTLQQHVIGQDEAVGEVAHAIRRARAGLANPDQPVGSFLFLGPTGVGKTQLCKCWLNNCPIAKTSVRLDMSEFMEKCGRKTHWCTAVRYEEGVTELEKCAANLIAFAR